VSLAARVVGRSRGGESIVAHERGDRGGLLVFGAIHGDEPESAVLCERFLAGATLDRALCVVPVVNPDGLARNHKDNAAGVDLNRNFAARNFTTTHPAGYFPGPHALSEPESAALAALVVARAPTVIVAVHQPFACVNWDGPADALARRMGDACGLPLAPSLGYPTPGSFGSWAGVDLGVAVITLELPRVVASWERLEAALLEAWRLA
jgi:protein MpaA